MILRVRVQLPIEYDIISAPGVTPVTLPDPSTVPLPFVDAHTPPATKSLRVTVEPTHTLDAPPITDGPAFTVSIAVALHANPLM